MGRAALSDHILANVPINHTGSAYLALAVGSSVKFGAWLFAFMNEHAITQKQLCRGSGFHANIVHGWKSGRNRPNGYSLAVLCTALAKITGRPRCELLDQAASALLRGG